FNWRVLHEALDERTSLLERVKFLAIFTSNLDEFFMKRISSLPPASDDATAAAEERRELPLPVPGPTPELLDEQARCYAATLRPRLARHGIRLACWTDLTDEQREHAGAYFDSDVSPVLTPLSLDAAHPFPYISNLSTSWAFRLVDPPSGTAVVPRGHVARAAPPGVPPRAGRAGGGRA